MKLNIHPNKIEMAQAAAVEAAAFLKEAIAQKGEAVFIAATGASQFEFLDALISDRDIEWPKTRMFQLDEYAGLPATHPGGLGYYLSERLLSRVRPGQVHLIQSDTGDAQAECRRLNDLLAGVEVDVAFVGIGENGHLAFNDPPADFLADDPFIIVELDEACRRQQVGEGWFASVEDVPRQAISMSIRQIMRAQNIVCTVPDRRKAQAVRDCFQGPRVTPEHPASILRWHEHASVHLDLDAASLLDHNHGQS